MIPIFQKLCDKLGINLSSNKVNSPSNKASIKESPGSLIQQASGDIHNNVVYGSDRGEQSRPQIDLVENFTVPGGPDGHFLEFKVKNNGNKVANNIKLALIADNLQEINIGSLHTLAVGEPSRLFRVQFNTTDFFKKKLTHPRIIFRYNSPNNEVFTSGYKIIQTTRADGNYNIQPEPGDYFDGQNLLIVEVEREKVALHRAVTLKDGLAESFSVSVPILIKNLSNDKTTVRNIRVTLEVPDGYNCQRFDHFPNFTQGQSIASRDVFSHIFLFSVSINGREGGANDQNPTWVAHKNKILSGILSAKIIFHFHTEAVAIGGVSSIGEIFDLTDILLSQIKTN